MSFKLGNLALFFVIALASYAQNDSSLYPLYYFNGAIQSGYSKHALVVKNSPASVSVEGSPYFVEDFQLGTIEVDGKKFGNIRLRYNAFSDQFEIENGADSVLILDKSDRITYNIKGRDWKFVGIEGKGDTSTRYIEILASSNGFLLGKEHGKTFYQGKISQNSFEKNVPARFNENEAYYCGKEGNLLKELKPKKYGVFEFSENRNNEVKKFINDNNIDLAKDKDLIKLFYEFVPTGK